MRTPHVGSSAVDRVVHGLKQPRTPRTVPRGSEIAECLFAPLLLRASRPGELHRRPRTRRPRPVRRVQPGQRQHQRHRRTAANQAWLYNQIAANSKRTPDRRLRAWPLARTRTRLVRASWRPRSWRSLESPGSLRAISGSTRRHGRRMRKRPRQSEAHGVEFRGSPRRCSSLSRPFSHSRSSVRSGATCGFRRSSPCPSSWR